jgi:hypothetical protein
MQRFILFYVIVILLSSCGGFDLTKDLKNPQNTTSGTQKYNNGLDAPAKPTIGCTNCKDESEKKSGDINPDTLYTVQLRESPTRVVWHLYKGNAYFGSVAVRYGLGTTVNWILTPGTYTDVVFTSGNKITMRKARTLTFGANKPKVTFNF